jgi:cytochrome c553
MNYRYRVAVKSVIALLIMLVASPLQTAFADEAENIKAMMARKAAIKVGRAKAQSCTRCHGRDGIHFLAVRAGWKDSDGQFAIVRLRALRDRTEAHAVMSAVANELKDEDIIQIAVWLDSLAEKR